VPRPSSAHNRWRSDAGFATGHVARSCWTQCRTHSASVLLVGVHRTRGGRGGIMYIRSDSRPLPARDSAAAGRRLATRVAVRSSA
jgi:hypothetical protein